MMRLDYIDQLVRMKEDDLDALAKSKRDDWHINCEWVIGTPGISPGLGHLATFDTPKFEKYPALGDFDLVREYLPYARKYGIHVLAYLDMHWFSYDFAAANPGWEQINAEGVPYGKTNPLYGNGTTLCVNSGWSKWATEMITETMKTGVEGVFLDGPIVFPGCCYCQSCREKFKAKYGVNIPVVEDWTDQSWLDFVRFRSDSLASFLKASREAMLEVNPEGIIFLNAGNWNPGQWRYARNIETVGKYQDFNGAEEFFYPGRSDYMLYAWATAAKHLVAGGKPTVVFSHHALGAWHYIPLPPIEAQLAVAETVACGANPWIAVFDYALDNGRELAVAPIREIQSFLEDNEEYYTGTKSSADIALLSSYQTNTYYISAQDMMYGDVGSGLEENLVKDMGTGKITRDWKKRKSICEGICGNSYTGYFAALTREHIPFNVVLDKDITDDGLASYRVLILPNSACLSDAQLESVRRFVERGGSVIVEFETGLYNEQGRLRENAPLMKLFGLSEINDLMKPAYGEEYLRIKQAHRVTEGFVLDHFVARPPYSLRIKKSDESDVHAIFMNEIKDCYSAVKGESDIPALITNSYGKGRVAYIPCLVGDFYNRYKLPDYQMLIGNLVRWAYRKPLPIEIDCPQTVEVELRKQDLGRVLIHLVNHTGDMQRPISEIIPLKDIKIRLKQDNVKRVYTLKSRIDLPFTVKDGVMETSLSDLGLYEVVVVE